MEGQGGSLTEVLYGEAWPEVQFLNSLPFTPSKSHTMPLFIFVKSDTVVDGFGLNCLAWDQAPQWGKKTKKKKKSVSKAN